MKPEHTPRCAVRGHDHDCELRGTHIQRGTGAVAYTWECPTGRYRWFQTAQHNQEGQPLNNLTRSLRPRFGWRNP